ncbi:MAG: DUF433 domain-containing protein [Nitrospinae bacterium]|nr:DUF433 domain-containing protein [Nitrospinota bacterium]
MPIVSPKIYRPHITHDPNVCGGSPVITGTMFPVRSVVHYVLHLGLAPERWWKSFLTLLSPRSMMPLPIIMTIWTRLWRI